MGRDPAMMPSTIPKKTGMKFVSLSSFGEFPSSAAACSSARASPTMISTSPNCSCTSVVATISRPPRCSRVTDTPYLASNPSWRTVLPSTGLFVTITRLKVTSPGAFIRSSSLWSPTMRWKLSRMPTHPPPGACRRYGPRMCRWQPAPPLRRDASSGTR